MQEDNRNLLAGSIRLLEEASELLYEEGWKRWKSRDPKNPENVNRCSDEQSRLSFYSAKIAEIAKKLKGESK